MLLGTFIYNTPHLRSLQMSGIKRSRLSEYSQFRRYISLRSLPFLSLMNLKESKVKYTKKISYDDTYAFTSLHFWV